MGEELESKVKELKDKLDSEKPAFKEDNFFVYEKRDQMGLAAALQDYFDLKAHVDKNINPTVILAAAPSQRERARYLSELLRLDPKVRDACTFFHMDENIDPKTGEFVDRTHKMSFTQWLDDNYITPAEISPDKINLMVNSEGKTVDEQIEKYGKLLERAIENSPYVKVIGGIGWTGHFAYCDPGTGVAKMDCPVYAGKVELDGLTRKQEADDLGLPLEEVSTHASTLTMRALTHKNVKSITLTIPNKEKAEALYNFWKINPSDYFEECPAAAIRKLKGVDYKVYADKPAASKLINEGYFAEKK